MSSLIWSEQQFHENLEQLKFKDSLTAHLLEFAHFHHLQVCETEAHELNLSQKKYGIIDYIHSQKGALAEAQKIVEDEVLNKTNLIFFYGLGFGYIYDRLEEWLRKAPDRHLILIEHDLEVVYHFLHTNLASQLLQDPQVTLFYCSDIFSILSQDKLSKLFIQFPFHSLQFLVLPSYILRHEGRAFDICRKILFDQTMMGYIHTEYLSGQSGFVKNFYHNLLSLPDSYLSTALYGKFQNIPAIICGAGPSLTKNIEVLKNLKNRALIFAGGSSLNAVNAHGLVPHFGLGIDPNPEQFHRLFTNDTFHIPLFYRNRLEHQAFKTIPGEKIYVPGSSSSLSSWFEKQLDVLGPDLDEGHNVVNFSTEVARMLGCNPIIYVGLDLAFTEVQTYAKGIATHPLWLGISNPYAQSEEQVVARTGIDGKKITTKWAWIAEATWISDYARIHPEIQMINATEGGLGFPPIPNLTLKQAAESYLTRSYDLLSRVHGEIQNSRSNVKRQDIFKYLNIFKRSLEQCMIYCDKIIMSRIRPLENTSTDQPPTSSIVYESLMEDEVAYQYFLKQVDKAQMYLEKASSMNISINLDKKDELIIKRYIFLKSIAAQHLETMQQSVQEFIFSSQTPSDNPTNITNHIPDKDVYRFDENHLQIEDRELNLEIDLNFQPTKITENYPEGQLKIEYFYNENEELQGPSRFYSKEGKILAESWFVEGKRQGKIRFFYQDGSLYSLLRFKNDQMEGKQEYFFQNGQPHVVFNYVDTVLDGSVYIYNNKGVLIRELHYHQGKRHGKERLWDTNKILPNKLTIECEYDEGIPVETAREWDPSGRLRKETIIHHFPDDFDSSVWNEHGKLIQTFKNGIEDFTFYYEEKQLQIDWLEGAIKIIINRLDQIVKNEQDSNAKEIPLEILEELEATKKSIDQLTVLKNEMRAIQEKSIKDAEKIKQEKEKKLKKPHPKEEN